MKAGTSAAAREPTAPARFPTALYRANRKVRRVSGAVCGRMACSTVMKAPTSEFVALIVPVSAPSASQTGSLASAKSRPPAAIRKAITLTVSRRPTGCVSMRDERDVRDPIQVLRQRPELGCGGHPADAVEAREIHRPRVPPQCLFAGVVVVVLEVRQHELAQRAVHGLSKADACEFRRCDRAPLPSDSIRRDDVIVVAHRREIDDQRTLAANAQRGRGEDCALEPVSRAIVEHAAW